MKTWVILSLIIIFFFLLRQVSTYTNWPEVGSAPGMPFYFPVQDFGVTHLAA